MASDERPPVWVGHVSLQTADVKKTCECLLALGMRSIVQRDDFAVLELRGGTHLVVRRRDQPPLPGTKASFDLMYEDIDAVWEQCNELGYEPSEKKVGRIHTSFTIVEPGGTQITVNSSHAGDRAV